MVCCRATGAPDLGSTFINDLITKGHPHHIGGRTEVEKERVNKANMY